MKDISTSIEERRRIGAEIAAFRKKSGLTLRQAAAVLDINYSNVWAAEQGRVSLHTLIRIGEKLGYEVSLKDKAPPI